MPLTPADVHNVAFSKPPIGKRGYNEDEVDAFLDRIVATLRGTTDFPVTAKEVREARFSAVLVRSGRSSICCAFTLSSFGGLSLQPLRVAAPHPIRCTARRA